MSDSPQGFSWLEGDGKPARRKGAGKRRLAIAAAVGLAAMAVPQVRRRVLGPLLGPQLTFEERLRQAKSQDEGAKPAPRLRERLEPRSPQGGSELVTTGEFGPADYASSRVRQPESIKGILRGEDARRLPGGAGVAPPGLDGKPAVPAPGTYEMREVLESPAASAPGEAYSGRSSARGAGLSPGELRGRLGVRPDLEGRSSRAMTGQAEADNASYQLSLVGVKAAPPGADAAPESVASAGAAFYDAPQRAGSRADPAPVKSLIPTAETTAACAAAASEVAACRRRMLAPWLELTHHRTGLFKRLRDLGVDLSIECAARCPHECGPCQARIKERAVLCARIDDLVAKINAACRMRPGCSDSLEPGVGELPADVPDCRIAVTCGGGGGLLDALYCGAAKTLGL